MQICSLYFSFMRTLLQSHVHSDLTTFTQELQDQYSHTGQQYHCVNADLTYIGTRGTITILNSRPNYHFISQKLFKPVCLECKYTVYIAYVNVSVVIVKPEIHPRPTSLETDSHDIAKLYLPHTMQLILAQTHVPFTSKLQNTKNTGLYTVTMCNSSFHLGILSFLFLRL